MFQKLGTCGAEGMSRRFLGSEFSGNQMIQHEYLAKTSPGGSMVIQGRAADFGVILRRSSAGDGVASGVMMSITSASGRRTVSGLSLASCDSQAQSIGSCPASPDCSVWQQPADSFTCSAFALQQQSGIATRSERKAEEMTLKRFKAKKGSIYVIQLKLQSYLVNRFFPRAELNPQLWLNLEKITAVRGF
jgi:hypothetical protein